MSCLKKKKKSNFIYFCHDFLFNFFFFSEWLQLLFTTFFISVCVFFYVHMQVHSMRWMTVIFIFFFTPFHHHRFCTHIVFYMHIWPKALLYHQRKQTGILNQWQIALHLSKCCFIYRDTELGGKHCYAQL